MTAPKHTPTPWQPSNLWIGDKGNGPYAYPLGTDADTAAANANYLCRAVNAHARLVGLLQRADSLIADMADHWAHNDLNEPPREWLLEARALLAEVK